MKKNVLSLKQFTYLMLATIADNSKRVDLNSPHIKICVLPSNYKQCIENILCTGIYSSNGWVDMFGKLIDTEEYFKDHFAWEHELSKNIQQVLTELKKEIKYDLHSDSLLIEFKQAEVDAILKQFRMVRQCEMKHFTNLVTDWIYQRKYQHEYFDYSAKAIATMKAKKESKQKLDEILEKL